MRLASAAALIEPTSRLAPSRQYVRLSVDGLDYVVDRKEDENTSREVPILDNVNKAQLGAELLVVLAAAGLLLVDVLESGAEFGLGFIGIVPISASGWHREST